MYVVKIGKNINITKYSVYYGITEKTTLLSYDITGIEEYTGKTHLEALCEMYTGTESHEIMGYPDIDLKVQIGDESLCYDDTQKIAEQIESTIMNNLFRDVDDIVYLTGIFSGFNTVYDALGMIFEKATLINNQNTVLSGQTLIVGAAADGSPFIGDDYKLPSVTDIITVIVADGVTRIPTKDFLSSDNQIKCILLPDTLTVIEAEAFKNFNSLEVITIPDSVTEIGARAFENCVKLKKIVIPDNVTELGDGAFAGCESLNEVCLSRSLKAVNDNMFKSCINLYDVDIPFGIVSIGKFAFKDCKGLKCLIIPDSVTVIKDAAFMNCENLTEIALCQSTDPNILSRDNSIDINYKSDTNSIGESAFECCAKLRSVSIPSSVVCIKRNAFRYCIKLDTVLLSESLETIDYQAFCNCHSLEKLYVPDTVKQIGSGAFAYCLKLKEIRLPANLRTLEARTFLSCESLNNIDIPKETCTIKDIAFGNCTSLIEITIPHNVEYVGIRIFMGCTSLRTVYVSERLKRSNTDWGINDSIINAV